MQFYDATPEHDLTYSDVFLIPGRSSVASRLDVSLAPADGIGMSIPIVSSNMNSVTGPRLAAALAGGWLAWSVMSVYPERHSLIEVGYATASLTAAVALATTVTTAVGQPFNTAPTPTTPTPAPW